MNGKNPNVQNSPKADPSSLPSKRLSPTIFQSPPPGEIGESSDKEEAPVERFQAFKLNSITAAVSCFKDKTPTTVAKELQQSTEFSRNIESEAFPREERFWEDVVTEDGREAHERAQEERLTMVHNSSVARRKSEKSKTTKQ